MENKTPKILLIHTAFIGDLVLTTPLIKEIKKHLPDACLTILVIPKVSNIMEVNPHIDEIIIYDKKGKDSGLRGFFKVLKRIKKNKFDICLVPHRSIKSALISVFSSAAKRIGFDTSAGFFLFTHKVKYNKNIHEIDRNLSLLQPLNITVSNSSPEIYTDKKDQSKIQYYLKNHNIDKSNKNIAVAPGSVWPTKRWPIEYYKQLIDQLSNDFTLFIIGGKSDSYISAHIPLRSNIIDLIGKLSIRESAELLRHCDLIICNDSAPLHLASAVKTPIIAIFGPTVREFGFYPYLVDYKILELDLDCRPCGLHGGVKCPINTHECMLGISVRKVYYETYKMINK
jgi:heptosyltransferase-2